MTRRRRTWIVLLVVLALVLGAGSLVENSVSGTVAGRSVLASSKNVLVTASYSGGLSDAMIQLGDDSATVTEHAVTIGDRSIPIPAPCQSIEIQQTGRGLVVSFDGVAQD